jgi:hypothetical protein
MVEFFNLEMQEIVILILVGLLVIGGPVLAVLLALAQARRSEEAENPDRVAQLREEVEELREEVADLKTRTGARSPAHT